MNNFLLVLLSIPSINFLLAQTQDGTHSNFTWQQRVDYSVKAELFPDKNELHGTATITYYNNSPDTLATLVWHLYQNVFRKDTSPRKNDEQNSRALVVTKGMTIEKILIDSVSLETKIDETLMETPLPKPLPPDSTITLLVDWQYDIPRNPDLRTGNDGDDFGICQWYPQIGVYDAERGWDRTPYLGIAEFYTEYGNWNVEITLPKKFVVASTGTLLNPSDILTPEQYARFNAISKDSVIQIIRDNGKVAIDDTASEKRTWKFSAEYVRDFAWATSPEYVWDATKTSDGVNIYAFYKAEDSLASTPFINEDADNWNKGAEVAKFTIEYMSQHYGKYLYPQATVISGPVRGMEYPMMVFIDDGNAVTNFMWTTIIHELIHEWYPMMIGSNETNYPFMDEGFTTFATAELTEELYGNNGFFHPAFAEKYSRLNLPNNNDRIHVQRVYMNEARQGKGASLMSHPYSILSSQYGIMAYDKPAAVMVMLEDLLGRETFLKAMNAYYDRWKFKHPYPHDFFETVEDVAGRDLDWFWNQWFDQTWKLDIALDEVESIEEHGRWKAILTLQNNELTRMPATIRLTFENGTSKDVRFSEELWSKTNRAEFIVDSVPAKPINVVIDPDMKLADVNRLNNSWSFPVSFDYGINMLNRIFYPLDSYCINAAPAIGFNLRDGLEIGTSINGSYIATDHSITAAAKHGTRSGVPDFELSYATPLRLWDPQLTTSAWMFRLDGFTGWRWSVEKNFEERRNIVRNYVRRFTIGTSILSLRVNDARYLDNPTEWNTAGRLDAGFISLKYFENFRWGKFTIKLEDEFGLPASSFGYSKLTVESMLDHPFIIGFRLHCRFFSGSSDGTVPAQSAFSLTQATPLERFDSWFFRTQVIGRTGRSRVTKSGGGNMFLSHDTTALQVASFNLALVRGPLLLFADAGTVWDSTSTRFKQFYYDAGIGYLISLGNINIGAINTGSSGFGIYFPIWVRDPSRPDDKEFDLRWKVVFGVRL
ncbi:MAG: M1 family metallopeptidase [Ignavibacteriales bacterium]|nr:M1 family metallopeptidase [Ignavibacteriales bacterium]